LTIAKANIGRAVDQPDPAVRFYLFHGPDGAQSRALGDRLLQSLAAERFIVPAASLKADPAVLTDEASAMNLFGGKRVLWVEPAGEDIVVAVEALLGGVSSESPVVAIAGALGKGSALRKLAESAPAAIAFAAYQPEGENAERMVIDVGRRFGLKINSSLAARLAEACGNDQAVVAQELGKLALYIDASPQTPRQLYEEAVDAVGAELESGDLPRLADLALSGKVSELGDELARLPVSTEAIPIVRALHRRLLMLAPARARVENGERPEAVVAAVGRTLYWRDKDLLGKLLGRWDAKGLARVAERTSQLERNLLFSPAPDREALGEELLSIARAAQGRR
jgi:DNA polymerase-3 subunit delta